MFALVKYNNNQYKVAPGESIKCNNISGNVGDKVSFQVLIYTNQSGSVVLPKDTTVIGQITDTYRGDKVIIFKKKRRQGYKRKRGHRQDMTIITFNPDIFSSII